jgi:hypothetical protein
MELKDRFFGKGVPTPGGLPVANPRLQNPPSLAMLFPAAPDLNADALTLALRAYHPDLAAATAEVMPVPELPPTADGEASAAVIGLVGWGRHVVKVVGFVTPMPVKAVERCVQPAHYDPALKEEAYQHKTHALLFYAGYETDVLERFVALAAVGAALARLGAIVVLNEAARTSVPAAVLLPFEEDNGDVLAALRTLPLPFLYAGFVKLEIEDEPGVWMRTYGCEAFGLPDLAIRAEGHHEGTATFNLFANLLAYLRESGETFSPGDTMAVGEGMFLRLRTRNDAEWFLAGERPVLVAERITPEEANTP